MLLSSYRWLPFSLIRLLSQTSRCATRAACTRYSPILLHARHFRQINQMQRKWMPLPSPCWCDTCGTGKCNSFWYQVLHTFLHCCVNWPSHKNISQHSWSTDFFAEVESNCCVVGSRTQHVFAFVGMWAAEVHIARKCSNHCVAVSTDKIVLTEHHPQISHAIWSKLFVGFDGMTSIMQSRMYGCCATLLRDMASQ